MYALAGFWLAPKLLRNALLDEIPKTVGLKPAIGAIRINPFLLQLEVKNFSLSDPGGEQLLGFERLFVEFELSSHLASSLYIRQHRHRLALCQRGGLQRRPPESAAARFTNQRRRSPNPNRKTAGPFRH